MPYFKVKSKRLEYNISIKGKYSVIQGNSGTGKTSLCQLIRDRDSGDHTIKVDSDYSVFTLDTALYEPILSSKQNCIFLLDEYTPILHDPLAAQLLRNSDNYFIIISRDLMDWLPLNIENIYDLIANGKRHYNRQRFSISNQHNFHRVRNVITEDSGSGKDFFQKNYIELNVISAHAKSNIVKKLNSLLINDDTFDDILVVFDSAAFGYQYGDLLNYIRDHSYKHIQILDWPSFEHFILGESPFNETLTQEDIGYSFESLEQASTNRLQELIPYSKHKLTKCLIVSSQCKGCQNISWCKYKHGDLCLSLQISTH